MTEEKLQEIADTYGLYTQTDVDNWTNELKAQIKDLRESLDIMNNRENELLEQIEKMANCRNCKHFDLDNYCVKRAFIIHCLDGSCDKWELMK